MLANIANEFCVYAPDCFAFYLPGCLFRWSFFIALWVTGDAYFENFPGERHFRLNGLEFC